MQLRTDIQLTSMLKAMQDVVLPAIDPDNRLAVEQTQLVIGMLSLMRRQLPLQFQFDRDELQRLIGGLGSLAARCAEHPALVTAAAELRDRQAEAAALHARCSVDPAELHAAVRSLRETISALLVQAGPAASLAGIERVVLDLSREQLLRDRALLLPQGWEPDPAALPSIHALLTPSTD